MEERGQSNSTGQHKLILQNRKSGSFTGVTDVVNFDANEIILDTELGRLTIKGKELHVNRLDLQKKEVEIDGEKRCYPEYESAKKLALKHQCSLQEIYHLVK